VKLSKTHLEKIDPKLQEVLEKAKGDEIVTCLMLLGPELEDAKQRSASEELNPAQFPSRKAYREKAISQRKDELAHNIGITLQKLRDLSLNPRGGNISPTVVVEGMARQILAALELPGVRHASLDRPIELIRPINQGSRPGFK
jgi:hypothetical protein